MLYHDTKDPELHAMNNVLCSFYVLTSLTLALGVIQATQSLHAILSDADALTVKCGNQFLTTKFMPQNLMAWDHADSQFDTVLSQSHRVRAQHPLYLPAGPQGQSDQRNRVLRSVRGSVRARRRGLLGCCLRFV